MTEGVADLWLPSLGDGLPECLLGEPLVVMPTGQGYFRLLTSSLWTPLTVRDSVRATRHPDGGYTITALAAAGPYTRVVFSCDPSVPAMEARSIAASWADGGAQAIEAVGGLFITAWQKDRPTSDFDALAKTWGPAWSVLEVWAAEERTTHAVADYLHQG